MALIGELVKTLNLYSNLGVGNHSNVNTNSNARGASKKFWMQKTQTIWVFLTWFLCFIAFLLWPLFFSFCILFLLSLGFALHYIHAFHSRCFLFNIYILKKKKRKRMERKRKHIIVLAILFVFENKVGQFIFTWHVCCTLFSFD